MNQAGDADVLLMRERPSEQTLRWLLEALDAVEVVTVDAMPGGSTSAMHRVTLRRASGVEHSVVVRRYVLSRVLAEAPDIAAHEMRALDGLPLVRCRPRNLWPQTRTATRPTLLPWSCRCSTDAPIGGHDLDDGGSSRSRTPSLRCTRCNYPTTR